MTAPTDFLTQLEGLMEEAYDLPRPVSHFSIQSKTDEANVMLIIFLANNAPAIAELVRAAKMLHDETADYITINNLGDPHHNQSMRMMRDALAALNEEKK